MSFLEALIVAGAGGLGAICRLVLAQWIGRLPWGILVANTAASFVAGFAAIGIQTNGLAAAVVISGICGGLSTFSTFSAQTVEYFKAKQPLRGVFNILLNFILPTVAVLVGALISYSLLK